MFTNWQKNTPTLHCSLVHIDYSPSASHNFENWNYETHVFWPHVIQLETNSNKIFGENANIWKSKKYTFK
jgi:hypothetical protein